MKITTFIACLLIVFSFNFVFAQAITTWEPPFVGSSKDVLYLPDANAVYWRYGWERDSLSQDGFVIKGRFPIARYFSYNLYNDNTKSSIASLADYLIKPDDNSGNYTIHVVPEGTVINAKNTILFPRTLSNVSIILRHYLPKGNIYGNTSMHKIEIYEAKSQNSNQYLQACLY